MTTSCDEGSEGKLMDCVNATWYTVCGRPHASFGLWMSAVSVIGVSGSATFWRLLGRA